VGSHTFSGLAAGSYEARIYANNEFVVIGRVKFDVAVAVTVPETVTSEDMITVQFDGFAGGAEGDWISIATPEQSEGQFMLWAHTNGQRAGSVQFQKLPAGTYEARAYVNDSYDMVGHSVTFTITEPVPAVEPTPDAAPQP
jgi:hypothetical protein